MNPEWESEIFATRTLEELRTVYEGMGGRKAAPEVQRLVTIRKDQLENTMAGSHLTGLSGPINQVFADWNDANHAFQEHGRLWAEADTKLKKLQGVKYLHYKATNGGPTAEVEAHVNADDEVEKWRMQRDINEALMKSDYRVIDLLEARWNYLQSLLVTERNAMGDQGPARTQRTA